MDAARTGGAGEGAGRGGGGRRESGGTDGGSGDGRVDGRKGDGAGGSEGGGEREEVGSLAEELARFVGGLVLIALGLIVSIGVVTAVIGVPMMVAGYVLYRSSVLSGRHERGVRMDYREEREAEGDAGGRRPRRGDDGRRRR